MEYYLHLHPYKSHIKIIQDFTPSNIPNIIDICIDSETYSKKLVFILKNIQIFKQYTYTSKHYKKHLTYLEKHTLKQGPPNELTLFCHPEDFEIDTPRQLAIILASKPSLIHKHLSNPFLPEICKQQPKFTSLIPFQHFPTTHLLSILESQYTTITKIPFSISKHLPFTIQQFQHLLHLYFNKHITHLFNLICHYIEICPLIVCHIPNPLKTYQLISHAYQINPRSIIYSPSHLIPTLLKLNPEGSIYLPHNTPLIEFHEHNQTQNLTQFLLHLHHTPTSIFFLTHFPKFIEHVPLNHPQRKTWLLQCIKQDPTCIQFNHNQLHFQPHFIHSLLLQNPNIYQHIPNHHSQIPSKIIQLMIPISCQFLSHFQPHHYSHQELLNIYQLAIKHDPHTIEHIPEKFIDINTCLHCLHYDPLIFHTLPKKYKYWIKTTYNTFPINYNSPPPQHTITKQPNPHYIHYNSINLLTYHELEEWYNFINQPI